ncbi:MAG: hypothetical protein A3G39_07000 [Deltaproteobacteria bacterium RIFCSPLOWO2_12_FULL_43_16]|nr:MAG: hypothetical protein A2Z89_01170 [Deltaproteobacteria bacterium GWA2_43_19]OGQ12751.1 MAG: hypothetical protein A3D30_05910 [Deltaproteobacteria bacterium RIFCSPHIGHO2_02_FULL_43_33]OGQ60782.1 MAG: hypothetical protein A3G39_07000 [Deltaproteobacteria bacterium RIFCSPLOWO2_12_FULL_43_16]
MTRINHFVISPFIFLLLFYSHAQAATIYHLHKERSDIREILQLSEAIPDARINALQSPQLKNQPPGEYLIKAFDTQAGVSNFPGVIPAGSTMTFSLWMKKTADFGAMHPLAKLYLNDATGTVLCSASAPSPLTTTLFNHKFTCTTPVDIAITLQDRFYLWVGVNMTIGLGANRVKAELDIEGTADGNYDSYIGISRHIVTGISPTSGSVGTTVTITGLNFGDTQGTSMVTFNGKQATVSSWSDTTIATSVPSGVSLSTGLVTVTINGITGNGLPFSVPLRSGYITTVAGNGSQTFSGDGGPAPYAGISPVDVAVDSEENLYIAGDSRIRKVDTYGTITTIAGTGESGFSGDGGPAIYAKLNASGLALDSAGNLYIAGDNRVRKISINGIITTVAGNGTYGFSGDGGPATSARLYYPSDVAVDSQGNLFIADYGNNRIRKVSLDGIMTTVAGNGGSGFSGDGGSAISAQVNPVDVAVDTQGNLYIADWNNNRIRKVDADGIITTVVGDETLTVLYQPAGIALDVYGNIYIADYGHERVKKFTIGGGITTVAGNGIHSSYGDGGRATSAAIVEPHGVALDGDGNLFIADWGCRIRKVGATITPVINSLFPTSGAVGTSVTISGSRFGTTQGTSTATFNGIAATSTSWNDTSIVTSVPTGASTGPVVVTVGGMSSNGVTFTVTPKITSLSPSSGQIGNVVSINGYNFGASQGTSSVTFNSIAAAPLTWSNTTITVPVPIGASTGPIVVTVNGMSSNEFLFTVTVPMSPEITSLSPASGPANSTITINGTNFGTTKGGSTVTLNGAPLSTTTWSDTSITALIPMEAATGPVIVTVNGLSSSSVTFTILTDTLAITYPNNGSVINRPDTVIIGRLPNITGDVGITVNGKIAMINGQDFAVNSVNLSIGENTITATMTDANGNTSSTSITVYTETQDAYVKLSSTLESSLAPMSTQLTLDTALPSPITETLLSIDGPASTSATPTTFPYTATLDIPGIYLATATGRTADGYSYEDRFALNALDTVTMDALLKAKWTSAIDALSNKDTTKALTYILSTSRPSYQEMFTALINQLPSIIATQTEFNLVSVTDDVAKYELITLENGETYSYEVILRKDENGQWLIEGF